jgi:hypothetical protein
MTAQPRNVNLDVLVKARRAPQIEFWHDNGDGTCTRLADGLTLDCADYDRLPVEMAGELPTRALTARTGRRGTAQPV